LSSVIFVHPFLIFRSKDSANFIQDFFPTHSFEDLFFYSMSFYLQSIIFSSPQKNIIYTPMVWNGTILLPSLQNHNLSLSFNRSISFFVKQLSQNQLNFQIILAFSFQNISFLSYFSFSFTRISLKLYFLDLDRIQIYICLPYSC
jgi:hypothetical protein